MKTLVVLNEQHTLLPQQIELLEEKFSGDYILFPVPPSGWTAEEMEQIAKETTQDVVFASPVPYLQGLVVRDSAITKGWCEAENVHSNHNHIFLFHNDKRDKKELPNGKVVFAIAQEGWELKQVI